MSFDYIPKNRCVSAEHCLNRVSDLLNLVCSFLAYEVRFSDGAKKIGEVAVIHSAMQFDRGLDTLPQLSNRGTQNERKRYKLWGHQLMKRQFIQDTFHFTHFVYLETYLTSRNQVHSTAVRQRSLRVTRDFPRAIGDLAERERDRLSSTPFIIALQLSRGVASPPDRGYGRDRLHPSGPFRLAQRTHVLNHNDGADGNHSTYVSPKPFLHATPFIWGRS
jgi:hypothetical protein